MKSEVIKSRLDIVKYGFGVAFSLALILTNLIGVSTQIFISSDNLFNPTLSTLRNFGIETNTFFDELRNKSFVLNENIQLKKQIAELESVKAQNDELKRDLEEVQKIAGVKLQTNKTYATLKIRGLQNLYSITPFVIIETQNIKISVGDPIYYDKEQLFGFVSEVSGLTAKVIPFYSPDLKFRVPAKSSKDPTQTGFISPIENGIVKIKNVGKTSSVTPGDIWVSTNDRAEVPADLKIGKVKNVFEDKESGFKELEIEAPFELLRLKYLLIQVND